VLQRRPNTFAQTILSLSFSLATKRRTIHSRLADHPGQRSLWIQACDLTDPFYQRPYVWAKEQWEPLWNDVVSLAALRPRRGCVSSTS
jgi:hypothetical protein